MAAKTLFAVRQAHVIVNGKLVSLDRCSRFYLRILAAIDLNNKLVSDSRYEVDSVCTGSDGHLVYICFKDGRKREFLSLRRNNDFARLLVGHIFMGGFMGNARKSSQPASSGQGNLAFL